MKGKDFVNNWVSDIRQQSKNGNIFSVGPKLYSYGYHYLIAEKIEDIILYNTATYSRSTSTHVGLTKRAINGSHYIGCPCSFSEGTWNLSDAVSGVKTEIEKAKNIQPAAWAKRVNRWDGEKFEELMGRLESMNQAVKKLSAYFNSPIISFDSELEDINARFYRLTNPSILKSERNESFSQISPTPSIVAEILLG